MLEAVALRSKDQDPSIDHDPSSGTINPHWLLIPAQRRFVNDLTGHIDAGNRLLYVRVVS
jgi:hypothetical protein